MKVVRQEGPVLLDREALAQWTKRSVNTIRARCRPVDYDGADGRALYDAEACVQVLALIPTRRRTAA